MVVEVNVGDQGHGHLGEDVGQGRSGQGHREGGGDRGEVDHADKLHKAMRDILSDTGTAPQAIDQIIYVGGSSLLSVVQDTAKTLFPEAEHRVSEVFTAVADGLAIAAETRQHAHPA